MKPHTIENENSDFVYTVYLDPPSLKDNTADVDRLKASIKSAVNAARLNDIRVDLAMVRDIPALLRKYNYRARCALVKESDCWSLLGLFSLTDRTLISGLAVDLGTTKIVLRLLDLVSGQLIGETAFDNPQSVIGPDILTRIHHAAQAQGLDELHQMLINSLNHQIDRFTRHHGLAPENIYLMTIAGNTTMTHFFLKLDPRWIIREPYIPVTNTPGWVESRDVGVHLNPYARIFVFPNVGSYFGGDLIAGIFYSDMNASDETALLVDVGTNAEVVLGNQNWLICCAGAAGPALEGGVTKMGMAASPGVIDKIAIDSKSLEIEVHTIEDQPPRGICGSGLIDLAAHMFICGMIDIRGKLIPENCGRRIKKIDGILHFIVVDEKSSATGRDLTITQADLDSLTRSKAAMYTILETITDSVGMTLDELSRFYVAGTFGTLINPESAVTIGMIPDLPRQYLVPLGNSSLEGTTQALKSNRSWDEIEAIRDRITYLELNVNQEFMNRFSAAKFYPHTDRNRFPSVSAQK